MTSRREQLLVPMSLDTLADHAAGATPGTPEWHMARVEFLRRQTVMQQDAAKATIEAADAAKKTAEYTRKNARYMLWSVIVLAASSLAGLLVALSK